jgi:LPXTG-motif cell wall-anchored protein
MSIRRLLAGAALGVVASVVVAVPAGAEPATPVPSYPPVPGGATVSVTNVTAGGAVTVSGSGFAADSTVTIIVDVEGHSPVSTSTVTAGAAGTVSVRLLLTVAGKNTIILAGVDPNGAPRVLTTVVLVAPPGAGLPPQAGGLPPQGGGAGGLPATGANILSPLVLGGVLVLGGAGAIIAARRRRRGGNPASPS